MGCILSFSKAVEPGPADRAAPWSGWGWVVVFGILLACAMGTKLTGWFLPLPMLAWSAWNRDRRGLAASVVGTIIGFGLLVLIIPPWWHDPMVGLVRFFQSNLSRGETMRIKTLFLGTLYETPNGSLPWYNTIVWTLMVTPVGFLVLGFVGIIRAIAASPRRSFGDALPHALGVPDDAEGQMPHTPGHDGVRQFLPAFGVLALLVGLGAEVCLRHLGAWARPLIVLAVAEGAVSVGPMTCRSSSVLLQSVRWRPPRRDPDGNGTDILLGCPSAGGARLVEHPHAGGSAKVWISRYLLSWLYLRQMGKLRPGILPTDPGTWAWYVLQNRPGQLRPMERDLIAYGHPAKVFSKWGIPLLWVFPARELEAGERGEWPRRRGESSSSRP